MKAWPGSDGAWSLVGQRQPLCPLPETKWKGRALQRSGELCPGYLMKEQRSANLRVLYTLSAPTLHLAKHRPGLARSGGVLRERRNKHNLEWQTRRGPSRLECSAPGLLRQRAVSSSRRGHIGPCWAFRERAELGAGGDAQERQVPVPAAGPSP